jgi:hypothetical protein
MRQNYPATEGRTKKPQDIVNPSPEHFNNVAIFLGLTVQIQEIREGVESDGTLSKGNT